MTDINTPTGGDDGLKLRLEGLTDEQKDRLLKMFGDEKLKSLIEGLTDEEKAKLLEMFGNKEVVLSDLKEHHVKIEENEKMMGYEGKKVHIDLPAVGDFEGFKFDYFLSNMRTVGSPVTSSELEKKGYSMKDVGELLRAMNRYMKELGVETDGDVDYEQYLQYRNNKNMRCNAGDCLKDIVGLDGRIWLKDKVGSRNAELVCFDDIFCFSYFRDLYYAKIFLKLTD